MNKYLLPIIFSAGLAISCGDNDDNGKANTQRQEIENGPYRVILSPVNPNILNLASGLGNLMFEDENFTVELQIRDALLATHRQSIRVGDRCPNQGDDINQDGFIDAQELLSSSGKILVPLDNDLSSQDAGGIYPYGPVYTYQESASFNDFISDLRLPDPNTTDELIKLELNENLNLDGKVIIVHGVSISTDLPDSVQTTSGLTQEESLPILCGVIQSY